MTVDHKAIADMAKLMRALGDDRPSMTESFDASDLVLTEDERVSAPAPKGDPAIDAMKTILEAFHSATDIRETARTDTTLAEALVTERTETGARIGAWEIVVNESSDPVSYDVVSATTGTPIASGLFVYEAAYGLVKRLNEGVMINDGRIRDLLKLEEDYARNRTNAKQFKEQKQRLEKKGDSFRAAVAEDRFDDAQRRAMDAHERILILAGLRK